LRIKLILVGRRSFSNLHANNEIFNNFFFQVPLYKGKSDIASKFDINP